MKLLLGLALLVALAGLAWTFLFLRRSRHAASQLSLMAERLIDGEYFSRVHIAGPRELAEVAERLNRLAATLGEEFEFITEHKNRYQAILEHMVDGVILLNPRKRIAVMNPAAERIFGISSSKAVGRHYVEVLRDYQLEAQLERVLRTGEISTHEFSVVLPRQRVLEAHLAPVKGEGGQVSGILVALRDISEARRLERMRTEFVANVSHELQTPLTAIKGYAETLLDGAMEEPENRVKFINVINQEAERLTRLISDLLDLSKIESGEMAPRRMHVRLQDVVSEVIERLTPAVAKVGLALEAEVPESLPPALADPDQISQVLMNLIDNSVKYTPRGGTVRVGAEEGDKELLITVSDTGIGIPDKHLDRIFERFYRVDQARARSSGGTGLGLAIVKHIVEAHGGRVSVESQVGQGTRFQFSLPKAPTAAN